MNGAPGCDQAQQLRDMMDGSARKGPKIITVTSGKGGVGKSSISVNLTIVLSRLGYRVLILDADFGLANIDIMLGVTSQYNMGHLLSGEKELQDIIQQGHGGVRFISGGSGVYELLKINESKLRRILHKLVGMNDPADIILIDTGAGVNDNILELVLASTETIVVTTPEPTAILDAYAMIKTIGKQAAGHPLRLVMNKCESQKEAQRVEKGLLEVIRRNLDVSITPLGYVLFDNEVSKSIKQLTPVTVGSPNSQAAKDMERLARRLVNLPYRPAPSNRLSSLFQRWLGG